MPPLLTSFSTLVLLLTMLPQTFLLPTASAASSSFTPTIDGDAEVLNRLFLSLSMEPLHTSWEVNDRKRKSKNKNKRGQQQQQQEEGALPPTVKWTEGPVPLWDGRLMFSDTILAKIFIWSPRGFLEEFLTNAGDAPKGDGVDRAEPGSNGLAVFDDNEILACKSFKVSSVSLYSLRAIWKLSCASFIAFAASSWAALAFWRASCFRSRFLRSDFSGSHSEGYGPKGVMESKKFSVGSGASVTFKVAGGNHPWGGDDSTEDIKCEQSPKVT